MQFKNRSGCMNNRGTSLQDFQTLAIVNGDLISALIVRMYREVLHVVGDMIGGARISKPGLVRTQESDCRKQPWQQAGQVGCILDKNNPSYDSNQGQCALFDCKSDSTARLTENSVSHEN